MSTHAAAVAEHWSKQPNVGKTRWWAHAEIHRHINQLVCGQPLDGAWAGFNQRIRATMPKGGYRRAISIGCGEASKEIHLLNLGLVQHFDLYDLTAARLDKALERARHFGVEERITLHCSDAFAQTVADRYDLVHWNNSLHHMMDVVAAVGWCRAALVSGGDIHIDDFVGASRFQWSDAELEVAAQVRAMLPDRYLIDPRDPTRLLPREVERRTVDSMIRMDPSEAADSARIVSAIRQHFPRCEVIPTGGVVYQLALNDVLANFHDEADYALLGALLLLDAQIAKSGLTHYAVISARK